MRFTVDHDLHIHSYQSACSRNPEQNPRTMLDYAKRQGLKQICITDHFWDEDAGSGAPCYGEENIFQKKEDFGPLPSEAGIELLFGAETEMDRNMHLGFADHHFDAVDFLVIPTTHLNMMGLTLNKEEASSVTSRANLWVKRLDALLSKDLPFHKIGIAHLTCSTMAYWSRQTELEIYSKISDQDVYTLMKGAAETGVGIEINGCSMMYKEEEKEQILRFYRIARECGCKFYCGSDAHQPQELDRAIGYFNRAIEELGLQETDKFHIIK